MPGVFPLIALALLITPIVELYVIIQVSGAIGLGQTFVLLIGLSVLGALLLRTEGLGVLSRMQARASQGEMPTVEIGDGALIVMGGALMLTPGFVTDAIGMTLIFPPTRILYRKLMTNFMRRRVSVYTGGMMGGFDVRPGSGAGRPNESGFGRGSDPSDDDIVDVEGWDDDTDPPALDR
jgi:UPF0716 protein FxsA